MSGQGTRFKAAGYPMPKPLIPVSGTPIIQRLLRNFPREWTPHFVMAENHRDSGLPELLLAERPDAKIFYVPPHLQGPSFAVTRALEEISPELPCLVSYCDYGMVWDPYQFERFVESTECEACLVSYRGFHAHYLNPLTYAFSRLEGERVVEVKEKGSFTDNRENEFASCGAYYFRSARLLKEAIAYQTKTNLSLNGEFYTSLTTEALIRMRPGADVRIFEIPGFFQWGTPADLQDFEFFEKSFLASAKHQPRATVEQVLMPMAGIGSRFTHITPLPKPLIPVDGAPMFEKALASLPKAKNTVLVALESFSDKIPAGDWKVVRLKETPPGQALSTEAGLSQLDANREVIVSACDHAIVLSTSAWEKFRARPDCDAAIFTVKGFPGAALKPQAFAYVSAGTDSPFPLVTSVSVKKPISDNPSRDSLLVGTFWFRSAGLLQEGIDALKSKNVRVNGELYLDSVFALLQEKGYRVREIPLDGYIGWGDPDSLASALYWQEIFLGHKIAPRTRYPGIT